MVPHALTVAGSDSGGGAGIQADLKTFSALGVYGASVITALTAQNTREVRAIHDVPAEFVTAQMDAVFEDLRIDVVKIGMLARPEVIEAVAAGLKGHQVDSIVLDPVMVAKSGDRLLHEEAIATLRASLVPLATVITPNLPEAGVLLDEPAAESEADMEAVSARLLELGSRWVLLKGGHLEGPESVDVLCDRRQSTRYPARRIATRNTHGTGCTLSSAIAAHLAWGHEMPEAVARAKDYLNAALRTADALAVGGGRGPVNHFHAWWSHAEVAG